MYVLTSSNMIHSPRFIALRKGPSLQVNLTVVLVSSGRSQPNSSDRSCRDGHTDHLCMPHQHGHAAYSTVHILHTHIHTYIHTVHTYVCMYVRMYIPTHALTVCSDRHILVKLCPLALAMAATKVVFPTPGGPSNRRGLRICSALSRRWALDLGPVGVGWGRDERRGRREE